MIKQHLGNLKCYLEMYDAKYYLVYIALNTIFGMYDVTHTKYYFKW